MALRLPPLNPLRFLEAAARLASFKAAAEELGITPSAVSHGIHTLENWLGAELFVRQRGRIVLTANGAKYLPAVCEALNILSSATNRIPRLGSQQSLIVNVEQAFALYWLLPRLPRFIANFPEMELMISSIRRGEFPEAENLAICVAREPATRDIWLPLMREVLTPVCTPALLDRINRQGEPVLVAAPLIHVTTASEDWETFLDNSGLESGASKGDLKFDTIHLALQAAREGLGIVLGRWPLVQGDLQAGHLAELGLGRLSGKSRYWLTGSQAAFERSEARNFRDWLLLEAEDETASQAGSFDARAIPQKSSPKEGYFFLD